MLLVVACFTSASATLVKVRFVSEDLVVTDIQGTLNLERGTGARNLLFIGGGAVLGGCATYFMEQVWPLAVGCIGAATICRTFYPPRQLLTIKLATDGYQAPYLIPDSSVFPEHRQVLPILKKLMDGKKLRVIGNTTFLERPALTIRVNKETLPKVRRVSQVGGGETEVLEYVSALRILDGSFIDLAEPNQETAFSYGVHDVR